jgi:SAM-dependent methyltransferase
MKRCLHCGRHFEREQWTCPGCAFEPAVYKGFPSFAPDAARGNDGWDSSYAARLAANESTHFWFTARNRLIVWALGRFSSPTANYLEVGCGSGQVLSGVRQAFPTMKRAASDVFCEGLEFVKSRCPDDFLFQADIRTLPYCDEFDAIGAYDVLEHIEDDTTALGALRDALHPGGVLVLTVPQHPRLWSVTDDYACHKRRYRRAEMTAKLQAAGFEIVRATSFVFFLLPALLLSRARMPKHRDEFDPLSEFQMSSFLNSVLERILLVEVALIRLGISFPVGSTLFVVARRKKDAA